MKHTRKKLRMTEKYIASDLHTDDIFEVPEAAVFRALCIISLEQKMMKIKSIEYEFSVCKVSDLSKLDWSGEYCFAAKTDEELSWVCVTETAPENCLAREDGWRAFRIEGELDFSLIGILARISDLMAKNQIGIFVVSTYNTDYVLVKAENHEKALTALENDGYDIIRG